MPEEMQSRFTVYERPDAPPGKCIVCGAVDRPVVDFGVDIEWADTVYGRAFFCVTCCLQAASKFPVAETDHDVALKQAYNLGLRDAGNLIADELRDFASNIHHRLSDDVPVYGTSDSVPEQTQSEDTTGTIQDKPESGEFAVETAGVISSQGSDGVSGDPGNGKSSLFG